FVEAVTRLCANDAPVLAVAIHAFAGGQAVAPVVIDVVAEDRPIGLGGVPTEFRADADASLCVAVEEQRGGVSCSRLHAEDGVQVPFRAHDGAAGFALEREPADWCRTKFA